MHSRLGKDKFDLNYFEKYLIKYLSGFNTQVLFSNLLYFKLVPQNIGNTLLLAVIVKNDYLYYARQIL